LSEMPEVSPDLNNILVSASELAAEKGHEYILSEHILYVMLQDARIRQLFSTMGVDLEGMQRDIEKFLREKVESFDYHAPPIESVTFSRLVSRAFNMALSAEKAMVDVFDILVSLFEEKNSTSCYLLHRYGLSRYEIIKEIAHGDYEPAEPIEEIEMNETDYMTFDDDDDDDATEAETPADGTHPKPKYLPRFAVNLTQQAMEQKIDPIIGRQPELERLMQTLCRRKKNNPLLVGEAGVGKTAIVEGLAGLVARGQVPSRLRGVTIWALDMGGLVAGTKFRGEFEERLKKVIDEVKMLEKTILFIDEIHTVVGAGAVSAGSLDASNILKPALNSGEIKCIGTTTYDDYKNHILKDRAFCRRFQKIDVKEPSVDDAIAIVHGLRPYYEEHYGVKYAAAALEQAVRLSARYMNDRFLPDKAIDVIDEAGARNSLRDRKRKKLITTHDIEEVVAMMANIPPAKVSASDLSVLATLEKTLKNVIFGQNEAVDQVVSAIKVSRAGIGNKDKTVGAFLFCGPTGCGKTELARQLAGQLGINFIRFDMSEYAEKHTISKLIGSPPGYVGFEQSGLLTEALLKTPHSVVLFDELEKAHSDIYNVLLQIMDYGTLTDNNGRKADFRNAILIMTSNVGARTLDSNLIGFGEERQPELRTQKEVEKFFSPEFRNRLDRIVYFHALDFSLMTRIVKKFLQQFEQELATRKVKLRCSDAVVEWFARHGFDPKMGARPLERLIRQELHEKTAEQILFGTLKNGGELSVTVNDDTLQIAFQT